MDDLPKFISDLPLWLQVAAGVAVSIVTLVQFTTYMRGGWRRAMTLLWRGRAGWSADCSPLPAGHKNEGDARRDANLGWRGGAGVRWSNMREQTGGEWYRLYLGHPRVISHIRVRHGPDPGYPEFYSVAVKVTDDEDWRKTQTAQQGPIDVELKPPAEVLWLMIEVFTPKMGDDGQPYGWNIYDLELTEVRLFRRWWRVIIR